jgi:DNA-binding transcriptional LysR family regulator
MRMDLTTLQVFLAAVEEGNIGRAAEREHIASSAVSKRIQDLEVEFGQPLLHRQPKGVTPTAAGAALADHVRSLFGILDRIRGEMSEHARGARGHVRVRANGSSIVEFLAADLKTFATAHPQIRIALSEGLSADVTRAVRDGLADLGIYAESGESVPPGLVTHPYRTDQLVAVVPATHPLAGRDRIALAEVLDMAELSVPEGSSLADLLTQAAGSLKLSHQLTMTAATNEVLRTMVAVGLAVAVLPDGFVTPYEQMLAIRGVPISDAWAQRQLLLCTREQCFLTVPTRLLMAHLLTTETPSALRRVPHPPTAS